MKTTKLKKFKHYTKTCFLMYYIILNIFIHVQTVNNLFFVIIKHLL